MYIEYLKVSLNLAQLKLKLKFKPEKCVEAFSKHFLWQNWTLFLGSILCLAGTWL